MASITDAMTPNSPPPAPREPTHKTQGFRLPLGFVAGLASGLALLVIITFVTESPLLGILFGLAPGIAIGLGLQLTARR